MLQTMSFFASIALRSLLSLLLILNGMGAAMASAPMSRPVAAAQAHAAGTAHAGHASPCPQQHDASAAADHSAQHDMHASAASHDQHPQPDCCKSSACQCSCAHACAWAAALRTSVPLLAAHDLGVRFMTSGHLSPTLPHLIRPPIV